MTVATLPRSELELVAAHEASHTTAALHFGWDVQRVTIAPAPDCQGSTLHIMPPEPLRGEHATIDALIALAGPLGEAIYEFGSLARIDLDDVNFGLSASADYRRARRRARGNTETLGGDARERRVKSCRIHLPCSRDPRNRMVWQNVERITAALLNCQTLLGGDLKAILAGYNPIHSIERERLGR